MKNLDRIIHMAAVAKGMNKGDVAKEVGRTSRYLWDSLKTGSIKLDVFADVCRAVDITPHEALAKAEEL